MIRPEDVEYGPDYERGYGDGYINGYAAGVAETEARLNVTEDDKFHEILRLRREIAALKDGVMELTSPTESGRQGGSL
jgi:hypothetical protein